MAKRFMYVSFGVLCLVAAYQLGARDVQGDWDSGLSGTIVGGDFRTYFTADGDAWTINESSHAWQRNPDEDLPVAASQVRFFSQSGWSGGYGYLVTTADEAWVKGGGAAPWTYIGPVPGVPVALDEESWGKVKAAHR